MEPLVSVTRTRKLFTPPSVDRGRAGQAPLGPTREPGWAIHFAESQRSRRRSIANHVPL